VHIEDQIIAYTKEELKKAQRINQVSRENFSTIIEKRANKIMKIIFLKCHFPFTFMVLQ
jgi:cell division ATPase FtsA